jgi:hypothetical protein
MMRESDCFVINLWRGKDLRRNRIGWRLGFLDPGSTRHGPLHHREQGVPFHRLPEKRGRVGAHIELRQDFLGVPGCVEDFEMGEDGTDADAEVLAVHMRHEHVRDHETDGIVGLGRDLQRLPAAFGFDDSIAAGLEHGAQDLPHVPLVVDDQHYRFFIGFQVVPAARCGLPFR